MCTTSLTLTVSLQFILVCTLSSPYFSFQDQIEKKLKSSQCSADVNSSPQKLEKDGGTFASPEKCSPPANLLLTPEQKERIEANKKAALARLQEKENCGGQNSLIVNMGTSWRNALKSEFSKTYFEEVFTLSLFLFLVVVVVVVLREIVVCTT